MPLINSKCYDGNMLKKYSTKSYLCAYYRSILDGTNLVCERQRKNIENLIEQTMDDKWVYNPSLEFTRRLKFIIKNVRLTKAPFFGKRFIPLDFFIAWMEALYSFRHRDNQKRRRFNKTLFYLARKNCKTSNSAVLCLAEFFCRAGETIINFSNNYTQAKQTYGQVNEFREMLDPNDDYSRKRVDGIYNIANNTKLCMVSGNTKQADGYLTSFVTVDEAHEMSEKGKLVFNALMQSMSISENELMLILTTDGFYSEGDFLDVELKTVFDIIDGKVTGAYADSYLPWIYMQDSLEECFDTEHPELWRKSNPTLGDVKKYSSMIQLCERSKFDSSVRATYLVKDCNWHAENGIEWLGEQISNVSTDGYLTKRQVEENIANGKYKFFFAGVDLSSIYDLSGYCALFPYAENGELKFDLYHKGFASPQAFKDNPKFVNAGYDLTSAIKDEFIEISNNGIGSIDVRTVADELFWFASKGLVPLGIYFDNKFSSEFVQRCHDLNLEPRMLNQNASTISQYINALERHIITNGMTVNPFVLWNIKNARCKIDSYGNVILQKKGLYGKIDLLDSTVNAFASFVDNMNVTKQYLGIS